MVFEGRNERMLSRAKFITRLLKHFAIACGIVTSSLMIGISGYHYIEGLSWIDSLLNSAMLLGGMGPINSLHSNAGKLFASFYALYCGIVFLAVASVMFAPVFHRLLHRFHMEAAESDDVNETK